MLQKIEKWSKRLNFGKVSMSLPKFPILGVGKVKYFFPFEKVVFRLKGAKTGCKNQ